MASKIKIARSFVLPLGEISGLALRTRNGQAQLCAIGDDGTILVTADVSRDGDVSEFEHFELSALVPHDADSQWEAVAADGAGNLFILQEAPGRVMVLNASLDALLHTIELRVDEDAGHVLDGWFDDENSRGEGLLLLANGHLLVVKEKNPPLLVEFGPRGSVAEGVAPHMFQPDVFPLPSGVASEFVPLQSWWIDPADDLEDLSDAAAHDGELYLISDQARCIVRVDGNLPATGGVAKVVERWELTKRIEKPESLVLLEGRVPIVAIDHDGDEPNLFVLEALPLADDDE